MDALESKQAKPSESASLGMEMAAAFAHMVEFYGKHYGITPQEAMDKVNEPPADGTSVLKFRPDQVTWMTFVELTNGEPERAAKLWEQLKEIARNELQNGHRAAKVVEGGTSSPAERAKFIVLREGLAADWKPRNGIEWSLIDTMALAQTTFEFWMGRLTLYSMLDCELVPDKAKETWKPPHVSQSDAMNQAATMADRFNKIYLRSLRPLRDLRRWSPTIVVSVSVVEVPRPVENPSRRIAHILDWHFVAKDAFVADLRDFSDKPISDEGIDGLYQQHLADVAAVQREQMAVLTALIERHGLRQVYVEGLAKKDLRLYEVKLRIIREVGRDLAELKKESADSDDDDFKRELAKLESLHRLDVLRIGAAGQLYIDGKLKLLPVENAKAYRAAQPVSDDGTVKIDKEKMAARNRWQVRIMLKGEPVSVVILGGAHRLEAFVPDGCEYLRVATPSYRRVRLVAE